MKVVETVVALCCSIVVANAFGVQHNVATQRPASFRSSSPDDWSGDVVEGGTVRGCSVTAVGEEPTTEWIINIDGVEADLGRFSAAIYKKIVGDAKQQQFQGFRPGTIPPHLQPTYRGFTMDECAKETVLEAMQQNNIRPFDDARDNFVFEKVSIPPVEKKKKKRKGGRKNKIAEQNEQTEDVEEPQWRTFDTMKEAIDAGWKPGQSFSFIASKVKGQKVMGSKDVEDALPIGSMKY